MEERFRERMRRERADLILRQTASLALEHGWDGFRVEDVAQRVGVAKGTIYLDFPDKEALVAAALRRCAVEFLQLMKASTETAALAGERLHAAVGFLARLPVENPELSAYLRWSLLEAVASSLRDIDRYMRQLVEDAQETGEMSRDLDAELAAQVILAASSVPASSRLAAKRGPDQLHRELTGLICVLPDPDPVAF